MSPVRFKPVKSSRWCNGEDESERRLANPVRKGRDLNNCCCAQHHDGVGGRGMPVQVMRLKVEVCGGGLEGPNARTSAQSARRVQAAAEVGAAHGSEEGGNDAGAKEPCLNEANREGKDKVMARAGGIVTPQKVRELQRKLCRKTKWNWRESGRYAKVKRKNVHGKPDAGESPVWFDEGWERQIVPLPAAPAYSTLVSHNASFFE
jgi:hypothetical protein